VFKQIKTLNYHYSITRFNKTCEYFTCRKSAIIIIVHFVQSSTIIKLCPKNVKSLTVYTYIIICIWWVYIIYILVLIHNKDVVYTQLTGWCHHCPMTITRKIFFFKFDKLKIGTVPNACKTLVILNEFGVIYENKYVE